MPAVPPGDKVWKNQLIGKFFTDVLNPSYNAIQKQKSDVDGAHTASPDYWGSSKPTDTVITEKTKFQIFPKEFSGQSGTDGGGFDNEFSTVISRSGHISAAGLADLFMLYGQTMTAVRRTTYQVKRLRTFGSGSAPANTTINRQIITSTIWTDQIAGLSEQYAQTPAAFAGAVDTAGAPFTNLKVGMLNPLAALEALIASIKTVVEDNRGASSSIVTLSSTVCHTSTCHSACHTSCHGSRGRR